MHDCINRNTVHNYYDILTSEKDKYSNVKSLFGENIYRYNSN